MHDQGKAPKDGLFCARVLGRLTVVPKEEDPPRPKARRQLLDRGRHARGGHGREAEEEEDCVAAPVPGGVDRQGVGCDVAHVGHAQPGL
jgi:hypothetical protein